MKYKLRNLHNYRDTETGDVVKTYRIVSTYDGQKMMEYEIVSHIDRKKAELIHLHGPSNKTLMPLQTFHDRFVECSQASVWEDLPESARLADSEKNDNYLRGLVSEQNYMYGNLVEEDQVVKKVVKKKPFRTKYSTSVFPHTWAGVMEKLAEEEAEGAPTQSPSVDPVEALEAFKKKA